MTGTGKMRSSDKHKPPGGAPNKVPALGLFRVSKHAKGKNRHSPKSERRKLTNFSSIFLAALPPPALVGLGRPRGVRKSVACADRFWRSWLCARSSLASAAFSTSSPRYGSSRLRRRQPQNNVAVVLAIAAIRPQVVQPPLLQPDQPLATSIDRVLVAYRAKRHRRHYRRKRLSADRNSNHVRYT